MPLITKKGKVKTKELPGTLQRSGKKAQKTYAKTLDSAEKQYGDGERAHRTAISALKHTHEKVGDHWEKKDKKGPSDEQAKGGRKTGKQTAGGVDAKASKQHLYDLAKRLKIPGRSTMDKQQLVKAIQKANDKESRKARS